MTVKASGEQTGGAFGLVESHIRAGSSPPLHVHHREDESFWVLAGNIRFRVGDEDIQAGAGSFVFLPREIPHTFVVEGDEDAHMLTLLTVRGDRSGGVERTGSEFAPSDSLDQHCEGAPSAPLLIHLQISVPSCGHLSAKTVAIYTQPQPVDVPQSRHV